MKGARGRQLVAALVAALVLPVSAAAAEPVHPVTVVVAGSQSTTVEDAVRSEFAGMSDYWRQQSNGLVDFRIADLRFWPAGTSCSVSSGDATDGAQTFAGFKSGPRKHLLLIRTGCGGTGVGTVPSGIDSGGRVYLPDYTSKGTWTHEFGHNLGFGHAGLLTCPGAEVDGDLVSEGGDCTEQQYGDSVDTMGASSQTIYSGFSTPRAIQSGFLPASDFADLAAPGTDQTYAITTRNVFTGLRSVQVKDPVSGRTYWIELASGDGPDAGLFGPNGRTSTYDGVVYRRNYGVRVVRRNDGKGTWALSTPPGATGERTTYWPAGSTFRSPSGAVEMTVESAAASTATVRVRIAGPPAGAAPPAPAPTQPAAPTTPVTPAAPKRAGRAVLVGVRVGKARRRARVVLRGPKRATVRVTIRARAAGRSAFKPRTVRVRAGKRRVVQVRLARRVARVLRKRGGRLRTTATTRGSAARPAKRVTTVRRLR